MVSNFHANFFINSGGSTSEDMLELISLVKEMVYPSDVQSTTQGRSNVC